MKLTVEISDDCLSQDPTYCEDFQTGFRCFFHADKGDWNEEIYYCDYYGDKLGYDKTNQSLRCKECKKDRK